MVLRAVVTAEVELAGAVVEAADDVELFVMVEDSVVVAFADKLPPMKPCKGILGIFLIPLLELSESVVTVTVSAASDAVMVIIKMSLFELSESVVTVTVSAESDAVKVTTYTPSIESKDAWVTVVVASATGAVKVTMETPSVGTKDD